MISLKQRRELRHWWYLHRGTLQFFGIVALSFIAGWLLAEFTSW
jgi:hypothetical protein